MPMPMGRGPPMWGRQGWWMGSHAQDRGCVARISQQSNMATPQGLWGPMFAQGPTFGALVLVLVLDKCGRWAAALAFTSL